MMARPVVFAPGLLCVLAGVLLLSAAPAAAQDYAIGPRDVLKIVVWGQEDLSRDYAVDQDGFVPFPLVGRIKAGGLTVKEFSRQLTERLERDYLVNPQVIVSVKEYLSKKVHVLGETDKPGVFYLTGPTTVLEILSKAGGLSKSAGRQLVLVRPENPGAGAKGANVILRLDLSKIQAGDASQNIRVEDEDTIFVPKANAFFVLGEVKSPGTFPFDKETSALEAVTIAGGFNERAAPRGVKLIRRTADGGQETVALDLSGAVPRDAAVRVREGDTVLVPKGNAFFVFGEVRKPGAYQLDKDTTILEGITMAGGFTDKAAPSRTRVIRNTPTGQQGIAVDVKEMMKGGHADKAMQLQENDVVVVPESFF